MLKLVSSKLDFCPKPRAYLAVSFYKAFLYFLPLKFIKQSGIETSCLILIIFRAKSWINSVAKSDLASTFSFGNVPKIAQ